MKYYVRIRSWHIIKTRVVPYFVTMCGRTVDMSADTTNDFGDDKTCESCLRIAAKA